MSAVPKILLIGSGGVGTMAAVALEFEKKSEVTSVIRSDYETAINKGFDIKSCDYGEVSGFRTTNIVKTITEAVKYGPFDYIVVTTKNIPELFKIEDLVAPVLSKDRTAVILIQNGIGIDVPIKKRFPGTIVLSGTSMISSTIYHGVVNHEGSDNLAVGYFDNGITSKAEQEKSAKTFIDIYQNKYNICTYDENVEYTRWRKLVYNASLNSVCTLTGVDVGRLEIFGGVDSVVRIVMDEIFAIAKSEGIILPEDLKEFMIRSDDGIWYSPSMLVDIRKGNCMEVEVIVGNPVKIAQKNGVSAPILTLVYELLKVLQYRTMEQKELIVLPLERPVATPKKPIHVTDYMK